MSQFEGLESLFFVSAIEKGSSVSSSRSSSRRVAESEDGEVVGERGQLEGTCTYTLDVYLCVRVCVCVCVHACVCVQYVHVCVACTCMCLSVCACVVPSLSYFLCHHSSLSAVVTHTPSHLFYSMLLLSLILAACPWQLRSCRTYSITHFLLMITHFLLTHFLSVTNSNHYALTILLLFDLFALCYHRF